MSFANINLGTSPGDHTGDPLRTAFDKINKNFWQITNGNAGLTVISTVDSVAGRTGNVTLTVSDIPGAITSGQVSAIVQSNLAAYANLAYVNALVPNVSTINNMISTAITAEHLQDIRDFQSYLQTESYINAQDIANLKTSSTSLSQGLATTNSNFSTANTAMKDYVDTQVTGVSTAWTANAATQANTLSVLMSNAATQAGQIVSTNNDVYNLTTLVYAYQTQSNAIVTSINTANAAIVTANSALKSYGDAKFAPLINPVFPNNLTVVGNLTINGNTTTVATNNVSVNDSIIYLANDNPGNSLDIGFVGHFNDGRYQHTGLIRTAGNGKWNLFSNVTPEVGGTVDLTNAVYDGLQVGNITSPTITDLYANAASQANDLITANTAMKAYVDAVSTALTANAASQASALNMLTANAGVQSDAIALKAPITTPSFIGNVGINANIVFSDGTYQSSAASGSGLTSRTQISSSAIVLGNNSVVMNLNGYKGYALYSIATSANTAANVWVTVYSNVLARTTDASRSVSVDPTPGTGIIAEVLNVGNVTQYFTPGIIGFNNEITANTNVPIKTAVTSANVANVTVTLTMVKLEN
jgi:hypothetical protein